jgi:hypothetical protein
MQTNSKATQFNATLEVFIRFLLLACFVVICHQLLFKWLSFEVVRVTNTLFLWGALGLAPMNLWLEWKRFQWSIAQHEITIREQRIAFLQGVVVSFFTPAFIATTIGRMSINRRMQDMHWIGSGVLTGLAQFSVTMLFAAVGSCYLFQMSRLYMTLSFTGAVLLSLTAYYFTLRYPKAWMRWKFIRTLQELPRTPLKHQILMLSAVRYLVFSAQFHLILLSFGVPFELKQLFILMLSFGLITWSPSILFGKIVLRELIAVAVFSWFAFPKEEVMLTAFFTWAFNVVLPVLFAIIRLSSTWKSRFF